MEDILYTLFIELLENVPNDSTRQNIYNAIIPMLYDIDSDIISTLMGTDDVFDKLAKEYLEEWEEEE
jgi:hypothetical protein